MNRLGEIACSALSNGHIADIKRAEQLIEGLAIKLHAVHGYISQQLKSRLIDQGIDLIIYRRKNRQAVQLSTSDKYHLKQRYKIETLFSLLQGPSNLVTSKAYSLRKFISRIYIVMRISMNPSQ